MQNEDADNLKTIEIEKKSFLVGGAVRDKLLGLKPRDLDYVVVNSSDEEMQACGFKQVGKSFPVYLHPKNGCEYVLIRGADSSSLKNDLEERDLTINSMAIDSDGNIIDPFGGQVDLKNKILKHTSKAFSEDPLRVIRVARFKTTLDGFKVAPATIKLMAEVARSPQFKAISGERVLGELKKAFTSSRPSQFFNILLETDCLQYVFAEINNLIDLPVKSDSQDKRRCYTQGMLVLDKTRSMTDDFDVLLAALVHGLCQALNPLGVLSKHTGDKQKALLLVQRFCSKFKVSSYGLRLSMFVCENLPKMHSIFEVKAHKVVRMLKAGDFRRNPKLIGDFVKICHADRLGTLNNSEYVECNFLLECQTVMRDAKLAEIVDGVINEQKVERAYSDIVSGIRSKYADILLNKAFEES